MPSRQLPALTRASVLLSTLPAVAGCVAISPTPPIPPAFSCAALIPDSDRKPVAPTALPPAEATAGVLWIALDDQTARLDQANGRAADVLAITQQCEAERAKLTPPARAGWLHRLGL